MALGSAAGPAFAATTEGSGLNTPGTTGAQGTERSQNTTQRTAATTQGSPTSSRTATGNPAAAAHKAATGNQSSGSRSSGDQSSTATNRHSTSGASGANTKAAPVERPDYVADTARSTTSSQTTQCNDGAAQRNQHNAEATTAKTATECAETNAKRDGGGWGHQGAPDSNGGWGSKHAQPTGNAAPPASASSAGATAPATTSSGAGSTAPAGSGTQAGHATTGRTGSTAQTIPGTTTGTSTGSNTGNTGSNTDDAAPMDYVPNDATTGTHATSNGSTADQTAADQTTADQAAAAQAAATARTRAWAQAQGRAAANGRPYADTGSDAMGTDKRGAGRDNDALRAVPSVMAALLAQAAGAPANAGSATTRGNGAGKDADHPATDPSADTSTGTGVYVPGVSAPGFGARIEATPEAPTGISVEPMASGIHVSWSHSGADVDHYTATAYDHDGTVAGSCLGGDAATLSCDIVNGVNPGTSYWVKVVAFGTADESEPSTVVTSGAVVPGPPSAPTGVHAVGQTPTGLTVSWTASSTPGSGIDHYEVTADQDASKGCSTNNATTLHCLVDTLSDSLAYTFTVKAMGAGQNGDSDPSAPSDPVTPGAPDVPTGVMAVPAGPNTLRISWTAPATMRAGVAKYVAVAVEDQTKTCDTSDGGSTYCEIDHLQAGGSGYTFRVQAKGVNASGDSGWSTASSPVVVASPPDAPTGVTVTPGDGTLLVHWTAPVNKGSGIDGYTVRTAADHSLSCGMVADTDDHCTITGLTNGTAYTVQVAADGTGDTGDSPWVSAPPAIPSKAPAVPAHVTATARVESIWVSWTAGDPGTGIAKFRATASGHGTTMSCEAVASATGCAITGLTAGTEYDVRVQALGQYGRDSEWSAVSMATPTDLTLPAEVPPSAGHVDSSSGTDVAPGEAITLSGTGYAPHTTITVVIYSAPQTLATTTTDGSGAFSVSVTVPAGYTGQHTLVASGVDSNGTARYLTLGVDVLEQHAVVPAAPVSHGDTTGSETDSDTTTSLPVTGDPIESIALFGLCMLLAGFAITVLSRQRFTPTEAK
ncbi:fibronectin type III domain-containing protein [Dactylosporangium sp. CS-033363]|uniref:fibronectin type III domain-containing protein n=1 Tax=Dactylosporangium sp. CS-033363 TaxID=3239935 RepID=UPI003D8E83D4